MMFFGVVGPRELLYENASLEFSLDKIGVRQDLRIDLQTLPLQHGKFSNEHL